jgi:NADPH:quinone reductase-like Zn-dependent oxidoreductase
MGAKVISITKNDWIKTDCGADYIIDDYENIVQNVGNITGGKMADVVLDSLGASTWDSSVTSVGINGRW